MKKVIVLLALAFLGSQAIAQSNEAEMLISMFKVEKKALLMDFLQLSEEEGAAFWPIYEAFDMERGHIAKKRIDLISKYAEGYGAMTAEQVDALANESFAIRASLEGLHKTYYKKFKKAVGAIRAAQFVQFERFVDNAIDSRLNDSLPLIGELD
jgi:hypothetical protein